MLNVAVIGDSLSAVHSFNNNWASQLLKEVNQMGLTVNIKNWAACGHTFYKAKTELVHENRTKSQVQHLDTAIKAEVDKLGLTPAGVADFNRLVTVVKSKIKLDLEVKGISENDKLILVFDVVKVVNDVAKSRMK